MFRLQTMIRFGGILHFVILIAGALVPLVQEWKKNLALLDPFLERIVWVYGFFILFTIVGFGCISLVHAKCLCRASPLARAVCSFIAAFWLLRLMVQLFVFDTTPVKGNMVLLFGHHMLTAVFIYLTIIYSIAAVFPQRELATVRKEDDIA